jgi:hypothetical protein
MTRNSEASLLDFCAKQREHFSLDSWLEIPHPDRGEFLAAVLFLAGVDWYGHRSNLLSIAASIGEEKIGHLSEVVGETGFDLSRFSTLLRKKIEHESVVRAS